MKTIGIVSTYSDLCGNATYAKALACAFEKKGVNVKIFDLKKQFFQSLMSSDKREVKTILNNFVSDLQSCDLVNIQYEFGLFGKKRADVLNRVLFIINNTKKISVTLHRVDAVTFWDFFQSFFHDLFRLKFKSAFNDIKLIHFALLYSITKRILKEVKKKDGYVIVHTPREKKIVNNIVDGLRIYDHPIIFGDCYKLVLSREKFLCECGFENSVILIGCCGFVSKYKGYETAINALHYLPEQYKLCILGGQHPASIHQNIECDPYLRSLIDKIIKEKLTNRVLFIGSINDDDLLYSYIKSCDHIVIPYLEVNQSGSGIVSLAFENNPSVIISRTNMCDEFNKYFKDSFQTFDIGNEIELAQKIMCKHNELLISQNKEITTSKYNMDTNVSVYLHDI